MSEPDRGAYAPQTDPPLAFDARQSRGGGRGPAPLTLLVSAIVLTALIVGLLLFYRHGMRHAGQTPELVGAPVGQTKSAPSSDTAANQAASLQVYKAEATPTSETKPPPSFETPPEQPAPLPAARPVQPRPSVISAEPLRGVRSTSSPPPAPKPAVVAKAASPHAVKPAPLRAAPMAPDTSYVAGSAFGNHIPPPHDATAPTAHVAAPPAKPAAPVALAAPPKRPGAAKPKPSPTTPSVSPETASASTPASASSNGAVIVQIGAFSSAALAQKGLNDDAHAVPGAMSGRTRKVESATKDGKNFYRAYVGGFATKADAASFCTALKAKDKPCFIAK
jgi:hypothetical protein